MAKARTGYETDIYLQSYYLIEELAEKKEGASSSTLSRKRLSGEVLQTDLRPPSASR
ncbi:hypothetical protein PO124_30945 [Bacillus licheniformis]|nr:hypothetical protein [Bacillus licheniformis]